MFLGEYQHSLDAKGRVILPAKFREELEEGAVLAKALDGCLAVYPAEEWQQVANGLREASKRGERERRAARSLFAGATEITPDKQGRVAVPPNLREYAGLERDVVVIGAFARVEIWDSQRWRDADREGATALAEAADDLPDFGL